MQVFLDGRHVEVDYWTARNVSDLVQHLRTLPEFEHRIVELIKVDDLELHDWEESSSVALHPDAHIYVKTQSVSQLIISVVQSAKEYLPRLDRGAVQAATLLHEGRENEAFALIGQLVEGLQWYTEFLGNLAGLVPQEEHRASQRLIELGNVMHRLVESCEGQDHTLLADLLEYELSPELQRDLVYVEALTESNILNMGNG